MILFTAIITTILVSVFWVVGIAGLGHYAETSSPPFVVRIHAPLHTEVGETIPVHVQVSNPTDQVLTLDNIDLASKLLDGFRVSTVDPPHTSSTGGLGSNTFWFSKTIASDGTLNFTFFLEAVKAGVWTGNVKFTNPSLSFVTSTVTIRVHEAGKQPKREVAEDEASRPEFVLGIDTPHAVEIGKTFIIRTHVTNPTDAPLVLDFIDFGGTLAEGLDLESVSPNPKSQENDKENWSLMFEKSLEPGETVATEFMVKAMKEGIWTGDLEFWDGISGACVTSYVTIRVNPSTTGIKTPD